MTKETHDSFEEREFDLSNAISFDMLIRTIKDISFLLDILGDNSIDNIEINIVGNKKYMLVDQHLVSVINTLKSIFACCKLGNFADANMLVRKIRDDLFQYLFILEASNKVKGLTEEETNEILQGGDYKEKMIEVVMIQIQIVSSGERKDKFDQDIDAWFDNVATSGKRPEYLEIKYYWSYLKRNDDVNRCIQKYGLEQSWIDFNARLNNYTHSNGIKFVMDNNISNSDFHERGKALLEQISIDINFIISYFLIILILIRPGYVRSSDYKDCMEVGIEPPADSQYWICSIVQDYLDNYITKIHPNLKTYLRDNTSMEIL